MTAPPDCGLAALHNKFQIFVRAVAVVFVHKGVRDFCGQIEGPTVAHHALRAVSVAVKHGKARPHQGMFSALDICLPCELPSRRSTGSFLMNWCRSKRSLAAKA